MLTVLLLSIGSAPLASATGTMSPAANRATEQLAASGAAGHDYATDIFADPWDYSNGADLLLDGGPAMSVASARISGGQALMRMTDNGYISPIWGGYGGPLFTGRDGAKPGNTLNSARYRTVSFQAYSDHDVPAGLMWFNCPGGTVANNCGGGLSFWLKAGWNTYEFTPGASVFAGWPVSWGGSLNGLRLAVSPGSAGTTFAVDWFRLVVPHSGASVGWSNPGGGAADVVWDANGSDADNGAGQPNWAVLGQVSGTSGAVDLSVLPPGNYRIGVRTPAGFSGWQAITLVAPLPRFVTPNAGG